MLSVCISQQGAKFHLNFYCHTVKYRLWHFNKARRVSYSRVRLNVAWVADTDNNLELYSEISYCLPYNLCHSNLI